MRIRPLSGVRIWNNHEQCGLFNPDAIHLQTVGAPRYDPYQRKESNDDGNPYRPDLDRQSVMVDYQGLHQVRNLVFQDSAVDHDVRNDPLCFRIGLLSNNPRYVEWSL